MILKYIIYASISFLALYMQRFIWSSNIFLKFSISTSSQLLGILIEFPQTKTHLEKGLVIKKESHDLSCLNLDDANPIGIIGTWVFFEILIMPSDTFWFGPLGPSGVIPTYLEFLSNLNMGLSVIDFSTDDVGILFNLKYFPTIAPNLPSLCPEAKIFPAITYHH